MLGSRITTMQLDFSDGLDTFCNNIGCCCVSKCPFQDTVCKSTECDYAYTIRVHSCACEQQARQPQSLLSSLRPARNASQSRRSCLCPLICTWNTCVSASCEHISRRLHNQRKYNGHGCECTILFRACSCEQQARRVIKVTRGTTASPKACNNLAPRRTAPSHS